MKENYIYPARIEKVGNDFEVTFLDFPNLVTQGKTWDEAINAAQEVLALTLIDLENEDKKIPNPTENIQNVVYIHIWMPRFRMSTKEVYVRKSVTIPESLNILAKEQNINFSAALVKGIKSELGIEN